MASCYDIQAELTVRALCDLQVDASSVAEAQALARQHFTKYPPMVSDGSVYDVEIESVGAVKRRKKA